jgi:hypothetical protein
MGPKKIAMVLRELPLPKNTFIRKGGGGGGSKLDYKCIWPIQRSSPLPTEHPNRWTKQMIWIVGQTSSAEWLGSQFSHFRQYSFLVVCTWGLFFASKNERRKGDFNFHARSYAQSTPTPLLTEAKQSKARHAWKREKDKEKRKEQPK